jgi:hypothetical protein
VATIDLAFGATNNLFRGGWLLVEPVVNGAAGAWGFENNFFDKIVFSQNADQSLDHNYNGYWPCLSTELYTGQRDRLVHRSGSSVEVHDVELTSAPHYTSGLLGYEYNFYQDDTSLTSLHNAGRTSAADLGLYHYTTRATSQAKEADSSAVDIGLHYVALDPTSKLPKDSDFSAQDGIPDYVENWHGDGDTGENRVHTDDETDWNNPTTDADPVTNLPIADPLNTKYDDIDLDADGLPGAAERRLATDPLVGANPLAGSSLAVSGTVSGRVIIPISIAPAAGDGIFMEFTVNGQPTAARVRKADDNWFAEWDTTLLLNGDYYVGLKIQAGGQSSSVACPGKLITIQNAIWFPDAQLTAGDDLDINAQTMYANGTWSMNIHDDQGNLFTSLSGNVDADGFCVDSATGKQGVRVSILDGQGNQLPSEYYDIQVATAAPAGGGGPGVSSTTRRYVERRWGNYRPGKWVVAYQRVYSPPDCDGHRDQIEIANLAVDAVYINGITGGAGGYIRYGNGAVMGTPPTQGNNPLLQLSTEDAWGKFVHYIGTDQVNLDVRNLFYFGHCDPAHGRGQLGGNDNLKLTTDAARLGTLLKNSGDGDIVVGVNKHPYRFVFICGCSSADTDLPQTFGIPKVKMSTAEFAKKYPVLSPRAFLGFSGNIPLGGIKGQPNDAMNARLYEFLRCFWYTWVLPDRVTGRMPTLQEAVNVDEKSAATVPSGVSVLVPINPEIYGCSDLLFDR